VSGLRILVLGGTRFVGRWIVETAVARGHTVTLVHRGLSGRGLFPDQEHVIADRRSASDLSALAGRDWDAVVDVCGYTAREVELSARLLLGAVRRYVFVSTAAVYAGAATGMWSENTPLVAPSDDNYGSRKVSCEQLVTALYGDACTIVRSGLVAGVYDPDERLAYWLRRIQRGGEVLVPGSREQRVQFVDARDLAAFALDVPEQSLTGCFNIAGAPIGVVELLDACAQEVAAGNTAFTWVPGSFLSRHGVRQDALPHYLPFWSNDDRVRATVLDSTAAVQAGFRYRSMHETVRSTGEWLGVRRNGHPGPAPGESPHLSAALDGPPDYLNYQQGADLLRKWHARA